MNTVTDSYRLPPALHVSIRVIFVPGLLVLGLLLVGGCSSAKPYTLGPIKTVDPDREPIPEPEEIPENMYWDRIDLSVFHQIEKPLNLNWTGRKVGQALGVASSDEADNVNVLDEPPNSSWYTRRHFYERMTRDELAAGPNAQPGASTPDTTGRWTVTSGKFEGATRGFVIKDPRGDIYFMKLDGIPYPELMSTAEVVSTKLFYAMGYNVPKNTVTYVHPDSLVVGDEATMRSGNGRRPMRRSDVEVLLEGYPRRADGAVRLMASKYVDGTPLGPFSFQGRKASDPNDRVRHEQRRELRGLRVIGSWINDTDRRAANTLQVYVEEGYLKHYIFDMGSTLGANASGIHKPIHGQAYIIDQRKIAAAFVSLGLYRFPWWTYDGTPAYPSVGYFRADVFRPADWVPSYPNPAMEKATRRDAFWGAKQVMAFRDDDIRAIVETAQMTNPDAEAHLIDVLKARRDKIGRYWFSQINPLDRFRVTASGEGPLAERTGVASAASVVLRFDDLAVTGNLEPASARTYRYAIRHRGDVLLEGEVDGPSVPLGEAGTAVETMLDARGAASGDARVVRVDLVTQQGETESRPTRVYVYVPSGEAARVVGLERE